MIKAMLSCYLDARPDLRIDGALSQKLRVLSYLSAFCVVCLHFAHYIDTSTWVNAFLNDAIVRGCFFASVSLFFIFSGMLLVKNFTGSLAWWKMAMKKRIKTLLIPYLVWCVGYGLVVQVIDQRTDYITIGFWLECLGISPTRVLPLYPHMWYVRNLLCLCAISPALIVLVQLLIRQRLGILLFGCIFACASILDFPLKDQTVMATLYFMIGIYLGFNSDLLVRRVPNIVFFVFGVILLLRGIGRQLWGTPPQFLHWVAFVFAIVCVWHVYDFAVSFAAFDRLMKKPWMIEVQNTSFFLYCFHMWIVLRFRPWPTFMDGWAIQPVFQSFVVMAVCYGLCRLIRRVSPWACVLLTGGR